MELLDMLTSQLGVTESQAKGGSGLIFKLVKEKLGAEDFGKVAKKLTGVEELVKEAPAGSGFGGMLGGLVSSLGGGLGGLGALAGLAGGFKKLNLNADMISKFLPIVLSFAKSQGGKTVLALIEKALKPKA